MNNFKPSLAKFKNATVSSFKEAIAPSKKSPLEATAGASENKYLNSLPADANTMADFGFWLNYNALDTRLWNSDYGYRMSIEKSTGEEVASYSFAINPSAISIENPVATTVETTMKGILETHNGAPLRRIALSGTTGVLPILRALNSNSSGSQLKNTIEYAFKNSIKAVRALGVQANRVANAFSGGARPTYPLNLVSSAGPNEQDIQQTGFAKINDLKRFLEYYIAGKKETANRDWRLCLYMYKDQEKYFCSLNNYGIQKGAGTIEYNYSIQLTAWKRAPIQNFPKGRSLPARRNQISQFARVLNTLTEARRFISAYLNVLSGIRADINDSLVTPLGETILLCKQIAGAVLTAADFAFSGDVIRSTESSIKNYFTKNQPALLDASAKIKQLGFVALNGTTGNDLSALRQSVDFKNSDGRASDYISPEESADPINTLFNNPAQYPEIFDSIELDSLELSDEVSSTIEQISNGVLQFTAEDMIERRDKIANFSRSISEALGGGSDTFSRVIGANIPKKTFKRLTTEDILILEKLNDIQMQMDAIIASMDTATSESSEDYYSFYRDFAVANGINFSESSISKFYVPFPFGATLESLAVQYLGSPERWIEIAALNSLKEPYVDEVGQLIDIKSSSGGNTLGVSSDRLLYVGQIVEISSDTKPSTVRKIREIDVVNAGLTLVTFEDSKGLPLTAYKPSENAKMKVFMPDTVNSNMLIAIPSTSAPRQGSVFKITPELDDLNKLARIAKIDIMLDTQGDIILTGGGDVKLAAGLTNIIQAATLKIRTKTNTLLQAPEFGNPADAGVNTSEASAQDVADALNDSFSGDPRFNGLISVQVSKKGPVIMIDSLVNIANTDINLPISAEVPKINNSNS